MAEINNDLEQKPEIESIIGKENELIDEDSDSDSDSDTDKNINTSIAKMDSLIVKLQEHTKINISSMMNNNNNSNSNTKNKNIKSKITENKIIKDESPEYYANEQIKLLSDECQEKDNKIKIINNILNISIIVNTILISYILGTWFLLNLQ